jgi:hypothetical protein
MKVRVLNSDFSHIHAGMIGETAPDQFFTKEQQAKMPENHVIPVTFKGIAHPAPHIHEKYDCTVALNPSQFEIIT